MADTCSGALLVAARGMRRSGSSSGGCGCGDGSVGESSEPPVDTVRRVHADTRGLRYVPVPPPPVAAFGPPPPPVVDVQVETAGIQPLRAIVAADATGEAVEQLHRMFEPTPPLRGSRGRGALDVRLQDTDGARVKSGAVIVEGPNGPVALTLDAGTRRFQARDLEPGEYRLRASSAGVGRGELTLTVRDDDVTRSVVVLEGPAPEGPTSIGFRVEGTSAEQVHAVVTDRLRGVVVHDGLVAVVNGRVVIQDLPSSRFHVDIHDGAGARSCYDTDSGDPRHLGDRLVDSRVTLVKACPSRAPARSRTCRGSSSGSGASSPRSE